MTAYREHAPAAALVSWMECAWTVVTPEPVAGYPVRPDGCLDIVYSLDEGLRAVGAMTIEQRYDLPAASRMIGIRFRPGMAGAFLRVAPSELTDATTRLEDLWGQTARELEARISPEGSAEECVRAIVRQLERPSILLSPIQRAIEAIAAAHGAVNLDYISSQANLSPRQFRRRCLEESGLTPKHLCRVLRFRRTCELASASAHPEWPAIAADTGYFDQAHLIRDFREFTGTTPMSVFSNTRAA